MLGPFGYSVWFYSVFYKRIFRTSSAVDKIQRSIFKLGDISFLKRSSHRVYLQKIKTSYINSGLFSSVDSLGIKALVGVGSHSRKSDRVAPFRKPSYKSRVNMKHFAKSTEFGIRPFDSEASSEPEDTLYVRPRLKTRHVYSNRFNLWFSQPYRRIFFILDERHLYIQRYHYLLAKRKLYREIWSGRNLWSDPKGMIGETSYTRDGLEYFNFFYRRPRTKKHLRDQITLKKNFKVSTPMSVTQFLFESSINPSILALSVNSLLNKKYVSGLEFTQFLSNQSRVMSILKNKQTYNFKKLFFNSWYAIRHCKLHHVLRRGYVQKFSRRGRKWLRGGKRARAALAYMGRFAQTFDGRSKYLNNNNLMCFKFYLPTLVMLSRLAGSGYFDKFPLFLGYGNIDFLWGEISLAFLHLQAVYFDYSFGIMLKIISNFNSYSNTPINSFNIGSIVDLCCTSQFIEYYSVFLSNKNVKLLDTLCVL